MSTVCVREVLFQLIQLKYVHAITFETLFSEAERLPDMKQFSLPSVKAMALGDLVDLINAKMSGKKVTPATPIEHDCNEVTKIAVSFGDSNTVTSLSALLVKLYGMPNYSIGVTVDILEEIKRLHKYYRNLYVKALILQGFPIDYQLVLNKLNDNPVSPSLNYGLLIEVLTTRDPQLLLQRPLHTDAGAKQIWTNPGNLISFIETVNTEITRVKNNDESCTYLFGVLNVFTQHIIIDVGSYEEFTNIQQVMKEFEKQQNDLKKMGQDLLKETTL